jgi:hypothetical protein
VINIIVSVAVTLRLTIYIYIHSIHFILFSLLSHLSFRVNVIKFT